MAKETEGMSRYLVALNYSHTLYATKDGNASSSQALFNKQEAEAMLTLMKPLFSDAHIEDLIPWYTE